MRKLLILLVILMITPELFIANGQFRSYRNTSYYKRSLPKYSFGVRAGLNYASQTCMTDDVDFDVDRIIGYSAGGNFSYFILHNLAVQPELMVSVKGSHWRDAYEEMKDVLTYIELPLLLSYYPVSTVNLHAGPQFGYLVNAVQKDLETKDNNNIISYFEDYDLGLTFGIEAVFPFRLNVALRMFLGLVPVTNDFGYVDKWKNNYIQVSASYRIGGR